MGRIYVVSCLVSGVAGILIALASEQVMASYGFIALGVIWIYVTSQAFLMAWAKDFAQHKDWMVRSYAATYAGVMLRIVLPVQLVSGVPFETAYIITSWACWVPNLLFAEWFIRRQKQQLAFSTP